MSAHFNRVETGKFATNQDSVDAMSATPWGVTAVTTQGKAGRFGLTESAAISVSAERPLAHCEVESVQDAGTHRIFLGRVVMAHRNFGRFISLEGISQ